MNAVLDKDVAFDAMTIPTSVATRTPLAPTDTFGVPPRSISMEMEYPCYRIPETPGHRKC